MHLLAEELRQRPHRVRLVVEVSNLEVQKLLHQREAHLGCVVHYMVHCMVHNLMHYLVDYIVHCTVQQISGGAHSS